MAFTLTLLGTDTKFSPSREPKEPKKPKVPKAPKDAKDPIAYDRAETLSYISTLISPKGPIDEAFKLNNPTDEDTEYRTPEVAVVNGPTTTGTEVGDRVARGVAAILEAISRGETDISIIAHSRGAVEAILVAHELERIQNQLATTPSDTFKPEFCNSVCPYTKPAMTTPPHKDTFEKLNWAGINANIKNAKLSMFNIDPVPGGNFVGMSRFSHVVFKSLAWRDPRFYEIPKIVKEYKQFVYENERTRCFKPIVPKCLSPHTVFELHSLPGHHGTGSGNLAAQQRTPEDDLKKPNELPTRHVQELVIMELVKFLSRNGVTITPRSEGDDPFAVLISSLTQGLASPEARYKKVSLELYDQIMANKAAYEHYNNTSYRLLGQEQSLQRLIWNVVNQRIVHYQAHNDTFLETIVPLVPGGHFLNYEHARMFLNEQLGLEEGASLSETIHTAVASLLRICEHAEEIANPKDQSNGFLNPTKSAIGDKLAIGLLGGDDRIQSLLLAAVGTLIEDVRKNYVQNKLLAHERQPVYEAIRSAFVQFELFSGVHPKNETAKKILSAFRSNVENIIDMKHKALKDHYRDLANRMQEGKALTDLHENVQQIIGALQAKLLKTDDGTKSNTAEGLLLNYLTGFAAAIKNHDPQKVDTQKLLIDHYSQLGELVLPSSPSSLAEESREAVALLMIQAAEDAPLLEETDLMVRVCNRIQEVIVAYNDLEQFKEALPGFKELDSTINNKEREASLDEYKFRLAYVTAQYIAEKNIPVNSIGHLFGVENQKLYEQIKNLAIAFGAVNPLTLNIQEKLRVIASLHDDKYFLVKMMAANDEQKQRMIEELQIQREAQAEQIRELTTTGSQQATQIQVLTERSEQLTQAKDLLSEIENRLRGDIQRLATKETQQSQKIAELAVQLKVLEEEKASLVETKQKLTGELEEFTIKDGVQTQKIEELNARINSLDVEKNSLTERGDELARTIEELRTTIAGQKKQVSALTEQVGVLTEDKRLLTLRMLELDSQIKGLVIQAEQQAEKIAALEQQVGTQAEENERLLADAKEQTRRINVLAALVQSLTETQKQSVANEKVLTSKIEGLNATAEVQAREVASLRKKIETQAAEIKSLTAKAEGLATEKENLANKIGAQARAIEKLTSDRTKQAEEIGKLTSDRAEQAKLIKQLTLESDEQAKMIGALTSDQAQQAQLINGMKLDAGRQQKIIEQLTTNQREKDDLIKELQGDKQSLAEQVALLTRKIEEQKGFIDPTNKFERSCLAIVENKLMPLTKNYLLHLAKEIRRNVDSKLDITNFSNLAKNVQAITWPEDRSSQLLKQKFEELSALNDILHSKSIPSEQVEKFYQRLDKAEQALAEHRDPWLQRFIAGAAKVLAIVLSGFTLTAKLGPTIVQSKGQAFFKEAKKIENDKPEPESDLTSSFSG